MDYSYAHDYLVDFQIPEAQSQVYTSVMEQAVSKSAHFIAAFLSYLL